MTNFIIVTAANDKYFWLLQKFIAATRAHDAGREAPIGVLDLDLSSENIAWLEAHGAQVRDPGWDYKMAKAEENWFKAMTARPNLPKHFPGHEVYLWLDCDTWVQDWNAVELYLEGAARDGFAVTPEVDRSYEYEGFYNFQYSCYKTGFGRKMAKKLASAPIINVGAFAATADAPHWEVWSEILSTCLAKKVYFWAEQTALNVAFYTRGLQASFLPARCNWICHRALPFVSEDGATLLEPAPPFAPLGILHLTAMTKYETFDLATLSGNTVTRPLCYPGDGD
ncbi:MAG: hypothetical protein QF386_02610 [Alphaproteobacteria bacterium]|jgi:lipopolysaccharide biosynthesis glycosyltransferase|nr:hypothetical protein [Rhodospirillaceae bacterium]MDP6485929.1 hypothetical protein [Alphaproteobacteria bacterium]MDP6660646.1 hypothetical protein [Alphaproteobacteria bacterium]MDP6781449.1 hypothetical protein [Alphaproteobacteria bacterium]MDP7044502.1 hypothetical protein [Alphaproteobacteria bacterium]|tara:strand:- start:1757 stop:2602 length:846 start_codon:yes stop_codon:yes gene_type:complete